MIATLGIFLNLNIFTAIISLVGVGIWTYWMANNRGVWRYGLPPLSWLVNSFLYYAALVIDRLGVVDLSATTIVLWSVFVWAYAAFLLCGIGVVVLMERLHFNGRRKDG